MAENGKRLITFVGSLLGSFLAVTYAIYQLVYYPLNTALAVETNKREMQDLDLRIANGKISEELNSCVKEQMAVNQQILVTLARIEAEIKK